MPARRGLAFLILLASIALSCRDSGVPNPDILGEWKRVGVDNLGEGQAEFRPGGSCDLQEGEESFSCRWLGLSDGRVKIGFGSWLPLNNAHASVTGDEMFVDYGDGSGSSWIRVGSPLESQTTDYFEGLTLIRSGDARSGIARWQRAADQGHPGCLNSLAWLYATDKNPALHDGKKAVEYAEKAVAAQRHHQYLDTLAAALARDGQFERAVQVQEEANSLLEEAPGLSPADHEAALERYRERLDLYRAGQPFTES